MVRCPLCAKPSSPEHKPFCSDRCRLLDLNRWFTGTYAIPTAARDDVDDNDLAAPATLENPPEKQ